MMFANLRVATRLGLGFGAVVILLLVLSAVSTMRLAALNDGVKRITEDRYPKVVLSKDVIRYTIDNGRQLRSMMLSSTDEERDKFRRLVETNRGKVTDALDKMDKLISTEKGRAMFKDITVRGEALTAKYDQLYSL